VKVWFTHAEAAALGVSGLPDTRRGIAALADREGWDSYAALARPRPGREGGGGWEYHFELWPMWSRLDYVARHISVEPADQVPPIVEDDALTANGRKERDARLAIVAVAERFAQGSGLTVMAADAYFAELFNAGKIPLEDWVRETVRKVSGRNIARWRSKARDGGSRLGFDRALSRQDTSILATAEGGAVRHFILALIAKNPAFSADDIRTTTIARFCSDIANPELADANGVLAPVPKLRAFQRTLGIWKERYRNELLRISDPDGYRSKAEFVLTATTRADRLNEVWQIDASPLDAITTTRNKRPTIYSCVDIYSRRMLILLTDTPRAHAVGLLLRKAILAWGVPEQIKTDNGSDFKAHYIRRLLERSLKIKILPTKAYDARAKGVVERSIGTFQHQLVKRIPGFVGHNPADRKVLENRKAFSARHNLDDAHMFGAEMTDLQVAELCDHWAEVDYAHRPHSGKTMRGRTPFEVAAGYQGEVRRIENVAALDLLLAPVVGKTGDDGRRKVGHEGIAVNKVHYHLGTLLVGDVVFCRQDPIDLGRIYVFKEDEETFLGVAENWELLGLDPAENAARIRALQKAVSDKTVVPVRKMMRSIGPLDVANAQRAKADAGKGNLVAFPQPHAKYETAALKAALDAVTPEVPRQADARTRAEQQRLFGIAATAKADATNVARLPETPEQRYRRAVAIKDRLDAGDAGVPAKDAHWVGRYMESSEFKGLAKIRAVRGEQAQEL
jgi:transposase InsO family protein